MLDRGTFVLQADGISEHAREFSLALELARDGSNSTEDPTSIARLDQEELLGLRARLAIMQIPEEEEMRWKNARGHTAHVAVDALKNQLQVSIVRLVP